MVFAAMKLLRRKIIQQILRFGVVGVFATFTHVVTVLLLVEWGGIGAVWSNFFAFSLAVFVSFKGHYHWTFNASTSYTKAFTKFSVIALLGLGLNQSIMYSLVNLLNWDYRIALAVVIMVVPTITFIFSRQWAFQPIRR